MPRYQCHFLDENKIVIRIQNLGAYGDDNEARREAKHLFLKIGHFRGYKLWQDGREIETYAPATLDAVH